MPALARVHNLAGYKNNAQGDGRFNRLSRHMHKTESRSRKGDAVCNREGRHSSYQAARAFHENHQREDKQQVVNSAQNVFDSKAQLRARHLDLRRRAG